MSRNILGYWDIRGLAEPIRYLLLYKNVDFEDKRYISYDSWQNDKFQLNLDFPNLPYYIDDKVRLTQSTAILRYLARKHDLDGKSEEEKLRVALAEQQIRDFTSSLATVCYNPEFEKVKAEFARNVPAQLKLFSAFLGERKFISGQELTYVDFVAYDTFELYRLLIPTVLDDFPNLKNYQDRFGSLPQLQEYLQSSIHKQRPIFSPAAYFGNKVLESQSA